MAKKGKIFVNRERKKPSAALPALLILVVSVLVAFSGAYAWQMLSGDQAKLEVKESMQPQTVSSEPPKELSESAASESADESGENAPSTASSSAAAEPTGAAVSESERVPSTYFDDAMFVGDSITSGILSYQIMQNTTVIAHTGINPDSIRSKKVYRDTNGNLVSILEAMAQHMDVKKIYLMLGSNSASWMDHDLFMQYYAEFLQSIRQQHPDATIYVQSILPINEAKFKIDYVGQELTNAKIDLYNSDISKTAAQAGAYFINVAESFKDSTGGLPDDATSDGMHFTAVYYQKWFDYLKTHTVPE